jgi:DNA mismatch repair protein MSH4
MKSITLVIKLKHVINLVDPLIASLGGSKSGILNTIYSILLDERITFIKHSIDASVNDDAVLRESALQMMNERCFAVKGEPCSLLNVTRKLYKVRFSF